MEKRIEKALQQLKIQELNDMQKASLQSNREGKDIILLSPTGTGKTLAFLLPLVEELKEGLTTIQTMILVPSRELALQINSVFTDMNTGFKSCCCYGGHSAVEEKKTLTNLKPAVVIGTPGRILDHISRGNIQAEVISILIIDEFDKSLELGFHDEMAEILAHLSGLKKRMLISATDAEEIPRFTGLGNTIKLNFLEETTQSQRLEIKQVLSPDKDKLETLYNLLCDLGSDSSIVFCNYRDAVDRVGAYLRKKGVYCDIFHGGMEQMNRERTLYKFRNGSCNVLISTDLAARGLDIPEIEHIIHYHLPVNEDAFTHRNGRTARWDASGASYLVMHAEEKIPEYIEQELISYQLPEQTTKPFPPLWATLYIGKGKKDKLSKIDIVGFLIKKGNLNKEDVGKIDVRDHYAFVTVRRKGLKKLLAAIAGEKIKGIKTIIEEAN